MKRPSAAERRDPASPEPGSRWTAPIGSWRGVPVEAHFTLVVVAVLVAGAALLGQSFGIVLAGVVVAASLAVHEAAHAIAAHRVGGRLDRVVLGLAGGLEPPRLPADPEAVVFVAMAGPMANLSLVVAGSFCLATYNDPQLATLLLPFAGPTPLEGAAAGPPGLLLAKLVVWINWPLFVLNLLPASPFDGRLAYAGLLWPLAGSRRAAVAVAAVGMALGALLVVVAPLATGFVAGVPAAAWVATLGLVVVFGARADRQRGGVMGRSSVPAPHSESRSADRPRSRRLRAEPLTDDRADEFDADETLDASETLAGFLRSSPAAATGDRDAPRQPKRRRQRSDAKRATDPREEEALVDRVLAKLHAEGPSVLTDQDRAVLERASQRYRRRRRD